MYRTYYCDTETVGLHGVAVLIQYAIDDGPVKLHHVFLEPIARTLQLIQDIIKNRIVAHNLRFDAFHLCKIYNMLRQAPDWSTSPLAYSIEQLVDWEFNSQFGDCLRPHAAVDTLLLAQKGENQSLLMDSKPIYVRRVPRAMAEMVRQELENKTELPNILFANTNGTKWRIEERENEETGEVDQDWVDLKLVFAPSNGLKELARYALSFEPFASFDEIAPPQFPSEVGYAPFAKLIADENGMYEGKPTWPLLLTDHIKHWSTNKDAERYAEDDITMLRLLYEHFGSPLNDEDSELAAQVAANRLRGFAVDLEKVQARKDESSAVVAGAKLNVNSPKQVRGFVAEALDPMEQIIISKGCDQKIIDEIKNEFTLSEEEECYCEDGVIYETQGNEWEVNYRESSKTCPRCDGKGKVGPGPMPVVRRVEHVEEIRKHIKRIQLCDKLLLAKRLYASFKVIGAKSGRMSGADDLNPQGVDRSKDMREMFTLADEGLVLSGGDFSSQELSVMTTAFHDQDLVNDMKEGKSLHGIFATCLDETRTYDEVMEGKDAGIPWAKDLYNKAKSFIYANSYGGTPEGIARRLGLIPEVAINAANLFVSKYPMLGNARRAITDRFSSLKQGDKGHIEKREVEPFIESMYGFRRYFDVEYAIQNIILDVVDDMPQEWKDNPHKVMRDSKRQRTQTIAGAIASALYGAAFSVQNRVIRAALNHLIQSASRTITMGLHYKVWDLQPKGIHPYRLTLMSIHDELMVVSGPEELQAIKDAARTYVEEVEKTVALIAIDWDTELKSWADKGVGGETFGWTMDENELEELENV